MTTTKQEKKRHKTGKRLKKLTAGPYAGLKILFIILFATGATAATLLSFACDGVDGGCDGGTDYTPPTTSITSPQQGATVSGDTVVLINADDDTGLADVQLLIDGQVKATGLSAPYKYTWPTKSYSNGPHSLISRAFDNNSNMGASTTINVTVDNSASTVPPPSGGGTGSSSTSSGSTTTSSGPVSTIAKPKTSSKTGTATNSGSTTQNNNGGSVDQTTGPGDTNETWNSDPGSSNLPISSHKNSKANKPASPVKAFVAVIFGLTAVIAIGYFVAKRQLLKRQVLTPDVDLIPEVPTQVISPTPPEQPQMVHHTSNENLTPLTQYLIQLAAAKKPIILPRSEQFHPKSDYPMPSKPRLAKPR